MQVLQRIREYLGTRKRAYHQTFDNEAGKIVLRDLSRFCRATQTTYNENDRLAAMAEGRREVWLRIQEHLQLSEPELWELRRPSQHERAALQDDDPME